MLNCQIARFSPGRLPSTTQTQLEKNAKIDSQPEINVHSRFYFLATTVQTNGLSPPYPIRSSLSVPEDERKPKKRIIYGKEADRK